jgi:hypothetical protein
MVKLNLTVNLKEPHPLTNRGTPIFQKLTIVQAKRDSKKPYSWGIDREQLFFLSNWPEFQGVTGIFPKRELAIPDYSGCLGSYYLYREPGDFVFISAKELEKSLGSRKLIKFDELLTAQGASHSAYNSSNSSFTFPLMHPKDAFHFFEEYCHYFGRHGFIHPFGFPWGDHRSQILSVLSASEF